MSESVVLQFSRKFVVIDCCQCSGPIAITEGRLRVLQDAHATFYCPEGHGNVFAGESEAEKLRRVVAEKERLLAAERDRRQIADAAREKAETLALRRGCQLKRVKRGVCPCCNHSFSALGRHMKTQHPEFIDGESAARPDGKEESSDD